MRRIALAEVDVLVARDAGRGDGVKASCADLPRDRGGQLVEAVDAVGEAGLGDRARHAVDGAGRLLLDEDAAAVGAHRAAPATPSLPMPVRTTSSRRRPKSLAASSIARSARGRRPPIGSSSERTARRSASRRRCRPPGPRSDPVGRERVAGAGLDDLELGGLVQARGERRREARRHVLDDHGAGAERRGQLRHEPRERRGAAGGGGDEDERLGADGRGCRTRRARRRGGAARRRGGRGAAAGARCGGAASRRPRGPCRRARRRTC